MAWIFDFDAKSMGFFISRRSQVRVPLQETLFTWIALCGVSLILLFQGNLLAEQATLDQLKADLKNTDPKVRKKSAAALGKSQDREAVPPLLAATQDSDADVREEVVKSLGLLRDDQAVTMLLTTLKDPVESVREESIFALLSLYVEPGTELVTTRLAKKVYKKMNPFSDQVGTDPTVVETYVKVAPAVMDGIADRLNDSSPSIRLDAAKALGVLRAQSAIPKMLEAMKSGDSNLKIAVLRSLYKTKDPAVDEQIMPYLNDSESDVRDETILTLGLLRSHKALPAIQKIYDENPNSKLRGKALQAISLIGDPSSLALFQRSLKDPDALYRQYAAEGIARVVDESLVEEVSKTFLKEKKLSTQLALSFALYRLGRREYMEKLISGLPDRMHHEQVTSYFIEMGSAIQPDLFSYLTSDNARVRERLCYVLGMVGDKSAVEKLKPLLKDPDSSVVSEAALALRRLGSNGF
jgi:HEAT repeat protein